MIDDLSSCRFFDSEIEKTAIGLLAIYFENLKHNIPLISRNDFYFENSNLMFHIYFSNSLLSEFA